MDKWEERLIHLDHCRGIGWKAIYHILKKDRHLARIYDRSYNEWKQLLDLPQENLQNFYHDLHTLHIKRLLEQYAANQIECLTISDSEYPPSLKNIFNPPWVLYTRGNQSLLSEACILAAVGSRKPGTYGLQVIKHLLPPLIKRGYVIASGLAAGIDTEAHKLAILHGGKTIGVLGSGLLQIYPRENTGLALEMMKKGIVISEYSPFKKAEPWMFPNRNRIISGLSAGVLLIEAKERSGSLITAYHAMEQGKDVFAVPGSILSPESRGTNKLIQDGAAPVLSWQDIEAEMSGSNQN
ncbi:DNA-processing protein DprA [Peribacillus sp. SCS-26]|uniref:DNA-processing protein DprA n=1 Tax=Paraperibacillus marinus TaxID=3115295 RepID=UPI0039064289